MRAGFIQFDVVRDIEENSRRIIEHADKMDCELIVLPELCDMGYLHESREELYRASSCLAENILINRLKELTTRKPCTVITGVSEKSGEMLYNTAALVCEGKIIGSYRKIHLSEIEKSLFNEGDINPVFNVNGMKIGVQICFDLWFPEISREQVLKGAEVLCALANFGAITTHSIACVRAIENLTPIVLCNRVGLEIKGGIEASFLGKSIIVDGDGTILVEGPALQESRMSCVLSAEKRRGNVICRDFASEIRKHKIWAAEEK